MTSHRPAAWADLEVESRFPDADRPWVARAVREFVEQDVDPAAGEEALAEAARARDEADRSCAEVFGPADAWADARIREWSESAAPRPAEPRRMTWAGYVTVALVFAAFVPVGLFVFGAVQGRSQEEMTLGLAAMPLVGAVPLVLATVYEHLLWRRTRRAAALAAGVAFAVLVVALTSLFVLGGDVALGTMPLWGWWVYAVALALGGLALGRASGGGMRSVPAPSDDEAWFARVGAELRTRRAYGDARVAQVLAEARSHVAESGRPARAELGDPTVYALSFPAEAGANGRRMAIALGVVAAVVLVVDAVLWATTGELAWLSVIVGVLLAVQARGQWVQGERARARQAARDTTTP